MLYAVFRRTLTKVYIKFNILIYFIGRDVSLSLIYKIGFSNIHPSICKCFLFYRSFNIFNTIKNHYLQMLVILPVRVFMLKIALTLALKLLYIF